MNTKTVLATLAFLGAAVAQNSSTITFNTPPSLVECQPVALSWTGGTAPYIIAVIPGGQPSAAALETIDQSATGTSETWTVNIAENTSVSFKITDSTGIIQYSDALTIQAGSSSCLSSSASGSSTAASGSTSAAVGAATTSGSASSAAASSASAASSGSAATSAAAATTTATTKASSAASGSTSKASSSSSASASASASASKSASGALSGFNVAIPAVVLAVAGGLAAAF